MKALNQWLAEYGESHTNPTNKLIHWICVPVIYFTIVGMLYSIPVSFGSVGPVEINIGSIVAVLVFIYYCLLSVKVALGMLLFTIICLLLSQGIYTWLGDSHAGLAITCLVLFVLAWILQFYGHNVEGKKPSFIKDLQFLMIGPAWVISFLFRKIGVTV